MDKDSRRFALFDGQDHEAAGGWNDLSRIGTLDECKAWALRIDPSAPRAMPEWAHIVDLDAAKMVCRLKYHYEPVVLTAELGKPRKWTAEWVEGNK